MIFRLRPATGKRTAFSPLVSPIILGIAGSFFHGAVIAAPLTEATVTRIENLVDYGETQGGKRRPAIETDVIRSNSYLLTKTDSRAELRYNDGSLVRIGQNTVFSFDANSRTLSLEKGSFIFFVPKGVGGGRIKTPSLAAAITGTIGKVSEDTIAIIEGEVRLIPSGKVVQAGFFARRNPDGTITIARFDFNKAWEGKLVQFNGPLPGMPELLEKKRIAKIDLDSLRTAETLHRTNASPSAIKQFYPVPLRERPRSSESKPAAEPPPRPQPPRPRPPQLRD